MHVQCLLKAREWEFTNNRTLVRDHDGRLLCGLIGGLVRVDLTGLGSFAAPICKLADIDWAGVTPERIGESIRLRPGRWSFHLRAYTAWFVEAAKVRYQFKLIGFDDVWSRPQASPEVTFTSLPPGDYRLMCRASAPLTGAGPEAELLRLQVRRPLWAMGWTAVLVALESRYDQLVRSRSRNESQLERTLALEQAVADRTQSLFSANRDLEALRDAYKRLSEVDELTQLGNRRNFEKEIARALALTIRLRLPLSLLFVDIDHFKGVNDRHGHQVGDEYLKAVGGVLAAAIRLGEDVATRFGGEEFAILLVNTGINAALKIAERMRAGVESLAMRNDGAPSGILTISIGVSTISLGESFDQKDFIARADNALYAAKKSGRNRVCAES